MAMMPQQREQLKDLLNSKEGLKTKLRIAEEELLRMAVLKNALEQGSEFNIRVFRRDERTEESETRLETAGVVIQKYEHTSSPTWTIIGEAIRRGMLEAIACQEEQDQHTRDQLMCDILGMPTPTEEPDRAPRGVRVRNAE
jgi:hypothetical protein